MMKLEDAIKVASVKYRYRLPLGVRYVFPPGYATPVKKKKAGE